MKATVESLKAVLEEMEPVLHYMSDAEFSAKPRQDKWSKKEVIGHLIDSAQNNLRRFISARTEDRPKIVYDQDLWVSANAYQSARKEDVIMLWRLLNERICAILTAMPPSDYGVMCNTSKGEPQFRTLSWLADDYVKHMKHHLNQVVPDSYDIVYP
jgi:hypothetical protein